MSLPLPKLTSLSTQTLTLILNSQRFPSSASTSQILKNLSQIRAGIVSYESTHGKSAETANLVKQYEKMRETVPEAAELESLVDVPEPVPPKHEEEESNSPSVFTPYTDDPDPDLERGQTQEEILQTQRQMMDEQDTHLTHLSTSLNRTHHLSLAINSELEDHSLLLDGLEDDLDHTDRRMSAARRRLDRVAEGVKGNGSAVIIGLLIFILLILIVVFKT